MDLWNDVYSLHARNRRRRELLESLMDWRNAIGHQDFKPALKGQTTIHFNWCASEVVVTA